MQASLFEHQASAVRDYLARQLAQRRARELDLNGAGQWRRGRSFVLARDVALELGSTAAGSVGFLIWTHARDGRGPGSRVWLVGPDVGELVAQGAGTLPFGQVVVVHGEPPKNYEGYLDLKEALYDLALEGVALRSMPSQGHLWCRIHRDAVAGGFGFAELGAAITSRLRQLDFVWAVDVVFHTAGPEALAPLAEIAGGAARVVGALIKRHEEAQAECDDCEYADVCDEREHALRRQDP